MLPKRLFLLLSYIFFSTLCFAQQVAMDPVVLISSYNPDVKNTRDNIEEFITEYNRLGAQNPVLIENMNCRNLSEAGEWEKRLTGLLAKHYEDNKRPAVLVLLGTEASTTYFSLKDEKYKKTPVVVGMRSNNILLMQHDTLTNEMVWDTIPRYLDRDFVGFKMIGGTVYNYDVKTNVELIKKLFPERDSIVFLSDNTLGGLGMRVHFLNEMKTFPQRHIETLDGRELSFAEVNHRVSQLNGKKVIVVGTWRIDNSDSYAMGNTTYSLKECNPDMPTFSLSSVGIGSWSIGGYIPSYRSSGGALARVVNHYLLTGKTTKLAIANLEYDFDYERLAHFGISKELLPDNSIIINEPISAIERYFWTMVMVAFVFVILLFLLAFTLVSLKESSRLRKDLQNQSEELVVERDRAIAADKMKSSFIANINHEIRTPLNAVVGFSQMLTAPDMDLTPEEKTEYGGYIKDNADLLLKLINDVLDISKIDADRMKYDFQPVCLQELCCMCLESIRSTVDPGVELRLGFPVEPVVIEADKLRMQQIFNNLLSNARKFTHKGSITIALEPWGDEESVCISVTDTGSGIPKEQALQVFERFRKLNNFVQGTGLGLSITQSLIGDFGGKIWVDTEYTHGARFVFTVLKKQKTEHRT